MPSNNLRNNELEFTPTFGTQQIPHYAVKTDTVAVPVPGLYESVEEYYSTLFHELVHSTGHPKRLMRFGNEDQTLGGKESYSLEELVAEIGASSLCAETGILPKTIASNAAYIDNWLRVLENNRSFFFRAASAAQKAVDYITGGGNPAFFSYWRGQEFTCRADFRRPDEAVAEPY